MFSRLISRQLVTFSDLSETQVSLASQTLSVSATAPIAYWIQVQETVQHWRTKMVWHVRLSQQFVNKSKSRCSPLEKSINQRLLINSWPTNCLGRKIACETMDFIIIMAQNVPLWLRPGWEAKFTCAYPECYIPFSPLLQGQRGTNALRKTKSRYRLSSKAYRIMYKSYSDAHYQFPCPLAEGPWYYSCNSVVKLE